MDFKKFCSDAGTALNRVVQKTEERFLQAERTEFDAHFENLLLRCDQTQAWTEKILKDSEALLQPNPALRVEEFVYDKLDKKKRDRNGPAEDLGDAMIAAGNDIGPSTPYGNALIQCGQAELRVGQADRSFIQTATTVFLQPLKQFLDNDMKMIQKERKILENLRLDLDSCKGKLKKAKSDAAKKANDDLTVKAEDELRTAQSLFDRQLEVTKLLLEGIQNSHAHHLQCLNEMIEAQLTYYAQCHQHVQELQQQLERS